MLCAYCDADETKVLYTRLSEDGAKVRRRRQCRACGTRFTTFETMDLSLPKVVKADKSRETFSSDKIKKGLSHALQKRPISTNRVDQLLVDVRTSLIDSGKKEITTKEIGERVLHELKQLDEVAYIRFASVYRSFQDASEFIEMIEYLESETLTKLKENQLSFAKI